MPIKTDYPRASLKNSLQLAIAVDELGGDCTLELAADKLNKKVGGAFRTLAGAAAKFGLLESKGGRLTTTQLFRDYKLAYTPDDANAVLLQAFLKPVLFSEIATRFDGKQLPVAHLEKMLIKEFGVPDNIGSRVKKYFLEGAKQCRLLDGANVIHLNQTSVDDEEPEEHADEGRNEPADNSRDREDLSIDNTLSEYSVRIKGPNIDLVIAINDASDLVIVDAMLAKIRANFEQKGNEYEE